MTNAPDELEPKAGPDAERLQLPDEDPGDGREVTPSVGTGDTDAPTQYDDPSTLGEDTGGVDSQLSSGGD